MLNKKKDSKAEIVSMLDHINTKLCKGKMVLQTGLDQSIEEQFTEAQQELRQKMYQLLEYSEISVEEVFLLGNIKKNLNTESRRASMYRGVSANGKKW